MNLSTIPNIIYPVITNFLSYKDFISLSSTCRTLNNIKKDQRCWKDSWLSYIFQKAIQHNKLTYVFSMLGFNKDTVWTQRKITLELSSTTSKLLQYFTAFDTLRINSDFLDLFSILVKRNIFIEDLRITIDDSNSLNDINELTNQLSKLTVSENSPTQQHIQLQRENIQSQIESKKLTLEGPHTFIKFAQLFKFLPQLEELDIQKSFITSNKIASCTFNNLHSLNLLDCILNGDTVNNLLRNSSNLVSLDLIRPNIPGDNVQKVFSAIFSCRKLRYFICMLSNALYNKFFAWEAIFKTLSINTSLEICTVSLPGCKQDDIYALLSRLPNITILNCCHHRLVFDKPFPKTQKTLPSLVEVKGNIFMQLKAAKSFLRKCPELQQIQIHCGPAQSDILLTPQTPSYKNLYTLNLSVRDGQISNVLYFIKKCPNITKLELTLDGIRVKENLKNLTQNFTFPKVRTLMLASYTSPLDDILNLVPNFPKITALVIQATDSTHISNIEQIQQIFASHNRLTNLSLKKCSINSTILKVILAIPTLQSLTFFEINFNNIKTFKPAFKQAYSNLKKIIFGNCTFSNTSLIEKVFKYQNDIQTLSFDSCTFEKGCSWKKLKNTSSVKKLSIFNTFMHKSKNLFKFLKQFLALEEIFLGNNSSIDMDTILDLDEQFKNMVKHLVKLTKIDTSNITSLDCLVPTFTKSIS